LKKFGIDALVISGGDDTGSVVVDLGGQGISCVHVPKTMDLDLQPYRKRIQRGQPLESRGVSP